MKQRSDVLAQSTVAAPLASESEMPNSFVTTQAETTEIEKRMLLFRLSEASTRIREESDLIRQVGFTDPTNRLLRVMAETVEEQLVALNGKSK